MRDDPSGAPVPTLELGSRTLRYDRARQRPLLWLGAAAVLPVGAEVDLPGLPRPARVVGVRLVAGGGAPAYVRLDVEVPAEEGEEAEATAAVPEPIAAATADLDLDPDAAKPLGAPLS